MKAITRRSTTVNRVLIVDNQGIMGAGLERLLSEEPSLEVLGITTKSETTLIKEIWHLQPDIIILTVESQGINPTRLMNLLSDFTSLRIILVSMTSNVFEVYDRQQISTIDRNSLTMQLKKMTAFDKVPVVENPVLVSVMDWILLN
jgi:chemotaxis response regulator CheB